MVDGLVGELRVEEVGQLKLVKCLNSCFFFKKSAKNLTICTFSSNFVCMIHYLEIHLNH